MAQNIHFHYKREEREHMRKYLTKARPNLSGQTQDPIAPYQLSRTLVSNGLDGLQHTYVSWTGSIPLYSSSCQTSYGSGISNIWGLHCKPDFTFSAWFNNLAWSPAILGSAFLQGLPCHMLPGLAALWTMEEESLTPQFLHILFL